MPPTDQKRYFSDPVAAVAAEFGVSADRVITVSDGSRAAIAARADSPYRSVSDLPPGFVAAVAENRKSCGCGGGTPGAHSAKSTASQSQSKGAPVKFSRIANSQGSRSPETAKLSTTILRDEPAAIRDGPSLPGDVSSDPSLPPFGGSNPPVSPLPPVYQQPPSNRPGTGIPELPWHLRPNVQLPIKRWIPGTRMGQAMTIRIRSDGARGLDQSPVFLCPDKAVAAELAILGYNLSRPDVTIGHVHAPQDRGFVDTGANDFLASTATGTDASDNDKKDIVEGGSIDYVKADKETGHHLVKVTNSWPARIDDCCVKPNREMRYTGPTAMVVSWIPDLKPGSGLQDDIDWYDRVKALYYRIANDAATPAETLAKLKPIIGLLSLQVLGNPEPKSDLSKNSDFWKLEESKEYRAIHRNLGRIECCNDLRIHFDGHAQHIPGFTPPASNEDRKDKDEYEKGASKLSYSHGPSSVNGLSCFRLTSRARFRIHVWDGAKAAAAFDKSAPWPWSKIVADRCCGGKGKVEFEASLFPSHKFYIDGKEVGVHNVRDNDPQAFVDFILADGKDAPGSAKHSVDTSATTITDLCEGK